MPSPDSGPGADDAIVVLTTTGDEASARKLARTLVEERLAACVTRVAAQSVYRWDSPGQPAEGAGATTVQEEAEVLLVIKTVRARLADLERRFGDIHPYDCPELVVLEPAHIGSSYLAWLRGSCD